MTVIKQQKSLLFGPECLQSKYYIELISILNLTIAWSDSNNTKLFIKRRKLKYEMNLQSYCIGTRASLGWLK